MTVVIPGGCTGKLQTLDVSINYPFKVYLEEAFDSFMDNPSQHTFTKAGNMRAPTKMQLCDMVTESWFKISEEVIRKSFVACGQVPDADVDQITCFKEGRSYCEGRERLKELMSINIESVDLNLLVNKNDVYENPEDYEVFVEEDPDEDNNLDDPLV